jgi:hypothetical protein
MEMEFGVNAAAASAACSGAQIASANNSNLPAAEHNPDNTDLSVVLIPYPLKRTILEYTAKSSNTL